MILFLNRLQTLSITAFVIGVLALAGCGPGRGEIAGTVTLENKTLKSGSIVVRGGDGMTRSSEISPDGTFEIKDVVIGEIAAIIHSPDPGAHKVIPRKKDEQAHQPKDRTNWFPIPEKYGDFQKSELKFQMNVGKNTWAIELKK